MAARRWAQLIGSATAVALLAAWGPSDPRPDVSTGAAVRGASQRPFGGLRPDPTRRLATGKLLVAARALVDPNFVETVIVLIDHSENGWAGLVVNRRTDVPVARLFDHLALPPDTRTPAYVGGPVASTTALGLAGSPDPIDGARLVAAGVHLVSTRAAIERLLTAGADAGRFRVYLGYAGWTAGQLEQEAATGAWHVLESDADTVFDGDPQSLWQRQISRTEWRQVLDGGFDPRSRIARASMPTSRFPPDRHGADVAGRDHEEERAETRDE